MDANLLKLFKYLWEERSSTRAAKRMFITQSAVSQSLKKLRGELKDDLFVRVPHGLEPTPKAIKSAPKILKILDEIESLSTDFEEFDPISAEGVHTLAMTDYLENQLAPKLVKELLVKAPKVKIRSQLLKGYLPKLKCSLARLISQ